MSEGSSARYELELSLVARISSAKLNISAAPRSCVSCAGSSKKFLSARQEKSATYSQGTVPKGRTEPLKGDHGLEETDKLFLPDVVCALMRSN